MSKDSLTQLEKVVEEAAGRLAHLQSENRELKTTVQKLGDELSALKRQFAEQKQELDQLKRDRKKIRSKVKKIQESISTLEVPMKETPV